jgi:hypothetical protein
MSGWVREAALWLALVLCVVVAFGPWMITAWWDRRDKH